MTFYTYMWLREDGTPYYVGKGTGRRAFRRSSPPEERVIIQEWLDEEQAFAAEKFLIAYYGRKDNGTGILINHTDGGEGCSGIERSEEQLVARAEAVRAAFREPEIHAKVSGENNGFFGKKHAPEARAVMREKAKNRAARQQTEEERAQRSASMRGRCRVVRHSEKTKELLRQKSLAMWSRRRTQNG